LLVAPISDEAGARAPPKIAPEIDLRFGSLGSSATLGKQSHVFWRTSTFNRYANFRPSPMEEAAARNRLWHSTAVRKCSGLSTTPRVNGRQSI
jgi:hypothetical protein